MSTFCTFYSFFYSIFEFTSVEVIFKFPVASTWNRFIAVLTGFPFLYQLMVELSAVHRSKVNEPGATVVLDGDVVIIGGGALVDFPTL